MQGLAYRTLFPDSPDKDSKNNKITNLNSPQLSRREIAIQSDNLSKPKDHSMCKVCEQKQITSKNANQDLLAQTKDSAMTAMINLELNPPKNQSLINQIRISNLKQQEKLSKSTASAFQNSYRMSYSQIHPYEQA